ncbi:MAG: hypothetical protein CMF04_07580 [Hyphomonas sp.]|nr:hypothetical protein [Hyphomonas sp.]
MRSLRCVSPHGVIATLGHLLSVLTVCSVWSDKTTRYSNCMTRTGFALVSMLAIAVSAPDASAQGQAVAWSPGYAGACGQCDLSGRNLTGWDLTGGNYAGANFEYSFMRSIEAGNANFEQAKVTGADMRGAILTSAKLSGAILSDARLQGVRATGAEFRNATMRGISLQGALLVGANFASSDLSSARLDAADLSGANMTGSWLNDGILTGAIFNSANMTGVSLNNARVDGASFKDVRFIDADLSHLAGLETADFTGACVSLSTQLPEELTLPLCSMPALSPALIAAQ